MDSIRVRIVSSYTHKVSQGLVEVFYNGSWGYVCGNGWTKVEASVTCKQLGYSGEELDRELVCVHDHAYVRECLWIKLHE